MVQFFMATEQIEWRYCLAEAMLFIPTIGLLSRRKTSKGSKALKCKVQ